MKYYFIIYLITSICYCSEICSRIAKINFQEVLVDAGDERKGEGLRYYLEKDPISKDLLTKYQAANSPSNWSIAATTAGSLLLLTGLFQTGSAKSFGSKESLLITGSILISINYLINKSISNSSEDLLNKSIEQYNKRNMPKIYFNPLIDNDNLGLSTGITQEF